MWGASILTLGLGVGVLGLSTTTAAEPAGDQASAPDKAQATASDGKSDSRVERVVVTAQKREQAVNDVPIAVSAIGSQSLEAKQIDSFRDLQFNVPSVTFSHGNFSGNNFQVRGIGVSAVAVSADSGVAVHTNDVYFVSTSGLATAEYYDLDRIEVLRGPQSTLYGRNATGGAVNVITAKPVLDAFFGYGQSELGTIGHTQGTAMINVPIVEDVLGLRLAALYAHHDGYVENLYTGRDVDGQDQFGGRASLRWQPSEATTIDLMAEYARADDTHMRYQKQMCHRDPTGVLGCLPDRLALEPLNSYATFGTTLASQQFWNNIAGLPQLGLFDLTAGPGLGASGIVPQDLQKIYSDFDPEHRSQGRFFMGTWKQNLAPWLDMTAILAYEKGSFWSQENYNQLVYDDIGPAISSAMASFQFLAPFFGNDPAPYINAFFSSPGGTGVLPLSGVGGNGSIGGNIIDYSSRIRAFDQSNEDQEEWTGELRFATNFDGPVNFLLAGYFLDYTSEVQYWVNANTLDYSSVALGIFVPGAALAPPYYLNHTREYELKSKAVFGEVYYEMAPDLLNLTLGLRWTNDEKHTVGQQTILSTYVPIGTVDIDPFLAADPGFDADPSQAGNQLVADQTVEFNRVTGRFVVDYHPDLGFTDETMIYASYARGFKSGGINPPLSAALGAVPQYFSPETVDAYEIGAKNTLADGRMQLNLTAWHYDYQDYQVSEIVNRTSVNNNISAKLWGLEGEMTWKPSDRWQFGLNVTNTESEIGQASLVNQRNPGAGQANAVVVKDVASGANCVVTMTPAAGGLTPADAGVPGFYAPAGGSGAIAAFGVPHVNFGSCTAALDPTLYSYTPNSSGIPVSVEGNELPQLPANTISASVQYTQPLDGDFELVARVDYYWQSSMWTRIFNNDPIDKIPSWDVANVQIQLNAGDRWYARVFATNLFDEQNMTNAYLTDASSGLFTNVFVSDPRVIGVAAGANF